jgi:hypothetical protein
MSKITPKPHLSAGAYDYDELKAATDAVMKHEHEDATAAQAAMDEAVRGVDAGKAQDVDPRDTPGYRWQTRNGPGEGKERIQVPIGDAEGMAADAARIARKGEGGKKSGNRKSGARKAAAARPTAKPAIGKPATAAPAPSPAPAGETIVEAPIGAGIKE